MMNYNTKRDIIKDKIYTVKMVFLPFNEIVLARDDIEAIARAIYKYGYRLLDVEKGNSKEYNCRVNNKYYKAIVANI